MSHQVHMKAQEAAPYICVKPDTLRVWRRRGRGPAYIKTGRLVLYRRSDLDAWLDANRVDPKAAS